MGRLSRSSRRRRSRARLSRSAIRSNSAMHSGSVSRRRQSALGRDNAFESVTRALSFASKDGSRSFTSSKGRRRSNRLLHMRQNPAVLDKGNCAELEVSSLQEDDGGLDQVQLVPGDDNRIVESMFGNIFDDASLLKVEVEQCVSLPELRTRPLHRFGVQKAVHLLRGYSIGSVTGHVCVGKFPVIAEIPSEYEERILDYFCSQGRDRETSKRYISTKKVYHVVNGGYEHEGRWQLIDEGQYQFSGIKWRTVHISWQEPKVLRAISIMSSQVQKKEFVVELSFLDEMVYLRRVIQDYLNEHAIVLDTCRPLPRGFCKEICKAYSGGAEYSNNTLRHLISIAAKISMRTMLMMRKVIDEECPSIVRSTHKKSLPDVPSNVLDTRAFRTLINSKTLRGAKDFLAPITRDEDRSNALHRLRYVAQENGSYKGVDVKTLENQLEAAIAGRKSIESFRLRILRGEAWPSEMIPLLQNILRTTKLDRDIKESEEDPDTLLEPLKMKYLECSGGEGGSRVEQYEKFVQDRIRCELESNGHSCEPDVCSSPVNHSRSTNENEKESGEDHQQLAAFQSPPKSVEREVQRTEASLPQVSEVAMSIAADASLSCEGRDETNFGSEPERQQVKGILEQLSIEVHGVSWENYNRTVLTQQEIFDLVISDPFQKAASAQTPNITPERRIELIQFVKKVLVPGGHVFFILPQLQMSDWLEAFENLEMKTEGVFLLLKDPDHVQRVKGRSFQNLMEVAVVARKPGRHPTKFVMDVISPYTQLPRNTYKRKAPVIDHVSPPANRLRFPGSKALVRTGEKSPALFWELMKTFCPAGGKVLDPFAATMTVGIASIQTGRSCVLLESDKECLALAETRLREFATKCFQEGEYSEPTDKPFGSDFQRRNQGAGNTIPDSSNCNLIQVCAEGPLSGREEDECEASQANDNSGDLDKAEESDHHSDVVPGRARSAEGSNCAMRNEKQDTIPANHNNTFSFRGVLDDCNKGSANELIAEGQDLASSEKLSGDKCTESEMVQIYEANETACEHVNRKQKAKMVHHVSVMEPPNTEGRPRRKRIKTSRYA